MSKQGQSLKEALQSIFATAAIIIALVISYLVFKFIMGNPINFEGGNPAGHPLPNNYLAIIYKGGMIVPLLMTLLIVLFTFTIERAITLEYAKGGNVITLLLTVLTFGLLRNLWWNLFKKVSVASFVKQVQKLLTDGKIQEAIQLCDKNKSSVANVMKAGLIKYHDLQNDSALDKEQKILAIQKEFEEAAALELPMLSKNLVILSTIASIAVLIGLIGTVLGMIRAFAALASAGSPDALALATGISEALINTAFGISGSTLAIILYNLFSAQIDALTYKIDESGFSLVQTFAASQSK
jgi:biopolymer transport protein ExbB